MSGVEKITKRTRSREKDGKTCHWRDVTSNVLKTRTTAIENKKNCTSNISQIRGRGKESRTSECGVSD